MYYVYEMQMPEEDRRFLDGIVAAEKKSLNDFFVQGFAYIAGHPDEVRAWKERYDQLPEEERRRLERIKITRIYPVEDGETEEEARNRQIQKEHDAFPYLDSPAALPVVSQQEFCDHIDDEDFFLTYGNPVIVRADSGTKLLAIAFPLYERYMRICGRGDEIDVINVDDFAKLLSQHWKLSNMIDAGSTNTLIDQIFDSVDDLLAGKMVCGAGGGGFLQVITKKGVSRDQLQERLKSVFQDTEIDVWDCTLV